MNLPTFNVTANSSRNSSGGAFAATLPAFLAGDIVFLSIVSYDGASGTPTFSATGWTSLDVGRHGAGGAFERSALLYRIMDGTEGSTVTITPSTSTVYLAVRATAYSPGTGTVFSGVGTPVVASRTGSQATTFPGISVTTTTTDSLVVCFIATDGITSIQNWTTSGPGTERYDQMFVLNAQNEGLALIDQPAVATGTYSVNGSWNFQTAYRAVILELQATSGRSLGSLPTGTAGIAVPTDLLAPIIAGTPIFDLPYPGYSVYAASMQGLAEIKLGVSGTYSVSTAGAAAPPAFTREQDLSLVASGTYSWDVVVGAAPVIVQGTSLSLLPSGHWEYETTSGGGVDAMTQEAHLHLLASGLWDYERAPDIVYGPDPSIPPPTYGEDEPDPDDIPDPLFEPTFDDDPEDGEGILISFTENANDEPVWTTVGT